MRYKRILLVLLALSILATIVATTSHSKVVYEDLVTMTIDGFESPGEWVIKFSKFRSKNIAGDQTQPAEDDQNKWLKWLASDSYKREELLPDGVRKNAYLQGKEETILAIRGHWDFPGYNWLALEPSNVRPSKENLVKWLRLVADENWHPKRREAKWDRETGPNFIWLPGKVKELYVYIWGGNFNYDVEAHFQDFKGNDYILPVANLNYSCWRKHRIRIPSYIRQSRHTVPRTQPLKFLRFKVISNPYEDPSEFYMYIDYFHAYTDIYEPSCLGEELQFVENYWGEGSASSEETPPNP